MSYAKWVRESHHIPLTLVENYYTEPLQNFQGWVLVTQRHRVGVYQKGNEYIVVCKGTTLTDPEDILDDARIAGLLNGENTLEIETRAIIEKLKTKNILVTGHSLGGRVALSIAKEFDLQSVVFNPAAPFTNPLTKGPGPANATIYHIVGDVISSHASPEAAEVIRVDLGYSPLQTLQAHTMSNFTTEKPVLGFKSVDQEDVYQYSNLAVAIWAMGDVESLRKVQDLSHRISAKPIPGSSRDKHGSPRNALLRTGEGFIFMINKIGTIDTNIKLVQSGILGVPETGLGLTGYTKKIVGAGQLFGLGQNIVSDVKRLGANLTSVRLVDSAADYQQLQAHLEKFNEGLERMTGKKWKMGDIPLESSSPLSANEIYAKADLQMIGIEDETIAKINFSGKTPNPEAYLADVSKNFNDGPRSLIAVHDQRLDWIENPIYESRKDRRVFPVRNVKQRWHYNPIYIPKPIASKAFPKSILMKKGLSRAIKIIAPAKRVLLGVAKIAGRVTARVFSVLVPVIAVADLAYTVYLLAKGIITNNYDDVVEHVTGVPLETWKEIGKFYSTGPVEYNRSLMESIRPSCERCPPGSALAWNGETCVYNPCEKRNGHWGVWDFKTNTCSYPNGGVQSVSIDLTHPGWDIRSGKIEITDRGKSLLEQKAAMDDFNNKKAQYMQNTEKYGNIVADSFIDLVTAGIKDTYKEAYDWKNICPK